MQEQSKQTRKKKTPCGHSETTPTPPQPPAFTCLLLRAPPSSPAVSDPSPFNHVVSKGLCCSPPTCPTVLHCAGLRQDTPCAFADARRFLSNPGGRRAPYLGGVSPSLPCRSALNKSPDTRVHLPGAPRAPGARACSAVGAQPLTKLRAPNNPGASPPRHVAGQGVTAQSPVLSTSLGPLTRATGRRHDLKRKSQPTPIFTTLPLSAQLSCHRNAAP